MAQPIGLFTATSGLFPGQTTLSGIDLTDANINGGNISGDPADDGSEVMFNLLNHFHDVVQAQPDATTKVISSSSSTISGAELVKSYSFTVRLTLDDTSVAALNVADESGE